VLSGRRPLLSRDNRPPAAVQQLQIPPAVPSDNILTQDGAKKNRRWPAMTASGGYHDTAA
jgi:hypothetical protein